MVQSTAGRRIDTTIDDRIDKARRSASGTAKRTPAIRHEQIDPNSKETRAGLSAAQRLSAERRLRDEVFEGFALEGGAWEILLDVYIQIEQGMTVSVSNAHVGSGVAPTTALRRIAEMEAANVLIRTSDPNDRRRSLVNLSDDAMATMRRYLSMVVPA